MKCAWMPGNFCTQTTLRVARRGKRSRRTRERERMAEQEGRRRISACSGIINAPPFVYWALVFYLIIAMSITRLAVNWFNYPICLWQAWFQPNCSSCGRRWQTVMWRREKRAPNNGHRGLDLSSPLPRSPQKPTTSMDPPTASTSATHSRERRRGGHMWDYLYSVISSSLGIIGTLLPCWRWKSLQGKPDWWTGTHRGISCIWILIYRC